MTKINNQAQVLHQKKTITSKPANHQLYAKIAYQAGHQEVCTEDYVQSVIRRYLHDAKFGRR